MNNICLMCKECEDRLAGLDLKDGDWCPLHRCELRRIGQGSACDHHTDLQEGGNRAQRRARRRAR